MNKNHVAVWIDHNEAKVFHIDADDFEMSSIRSPIHHVRRHPMGLEEKKTHPADAKHFFDDIARALASAEEILVVGPATAKLEFIRHLHKHDRALEPKIVGVETVDHPTNGQLAAYVRSYFRAVDRMRGTLS